MNVQLVIRPGETVPWENFVQDTPSCSVALDGYVPEPPNRDEESRHLNFNHHEGVDGLATRSTCAQVLMNIRMGLYKTYRDASGPRANVYVNDCDEDVCTSWFLLHNPHMVFGTMNPLLNRLIDVEDRLDCTAGAYPYPSDLPFLQEMAWIFQPYRRFRLSGGLDQKDPSAYEEVISSVEDRIFKYLTGKGGTQPLDTRYEKIGGGRGWTMVREIGANARVAMFGDGIEAFVSVRERPDGHYTYVIGRLSPNIPFPLQRFLARLNQEDKVTAQDRWGGRVDLVIGSPRKNGSEINPDRLSQILDEENKLL